jgi:hypothetical protein
MTKKEKQLRAQLDATVAELQALRDTKSEIEAKEKSLKADVRSSLEGLGIVYAGEHVYSGPWKVALTPNTRTTLSEAKLLENGVPADVIAACKVKKSGTPKLDIRPIPKKEQELI